MRLQYRPIEFISWLKVTLFTLHALLNRRQKTRMAFVLACSLVAITSRASTPWIHGAMVPAKGTTTTVCSTNNGCEGDAFLSCADMSQKIVNITFAAVGNLTQCPMPTEGQCATSARKIFESNCLGHTNCTGRSQIRVHTRIEISTQNAKHGQSMFTAL